MDPRAKRAFLLLVAVQACHSIEEYAFALYEALPIARFASGLVSNDLAVGYAIINFAFFAFGLWCYLVPVRSDWPSARAFVWVWVGIELGNGLGHPALAAWAGRYFPGVGTAPVLLVLALYIATRLVRTRRSWSAA